MLWPCSPPGSPHPQIRSSISDRSSWGTVSSTLLTTYDARSSGRTSTSDPLRALPIGERPKAAITAPFMVRIITPGRRSLFQPSLALARDDEADEAEQHEQDDAEHDDPVDPAPRREHQHGGHGGQPQRPGELAPAERLVPAALFHELTRQRLVGVEGSEDRVHALPLQAAESDVALVRHQGLEHSLPRRHQDRVSNPSRVKSRSAAYQDRAPVPTRLIVVTARFAHSTASWTMASRSTSTAFRIGIR